MCARPLFQQHRLAFAFTLAYAGALPQEQEAFDAKVAEYMAAAAVAAAERHRKSALRRVFAAFDLDGAGSISVDEMMDVQLARRSGQQHRQRS